MPIPATSDNSRKSAYSSSDSGREVAPDIRAHRDAPTVTSDPPPFKANEDGGTPRKEEELWPLASALSTEPHTLVPSHGDRAVPEAKFQALDLVSTYPSREDLARACEQPGTMEYQGTSSG